MSLLKRSRIRSTDEWAIWRGEDAEAKKLFLIKEVREGSANASQLRGRLASEIAFLTSLNHPQFVRPVRVEADGHRAIFEDVQASLSQYLRSDPLAPPMVASILLQAAEGLEYLNSRRKAHGTLSPRNLFVGPAGDLKFGDFVGYDLGSANSLSAPEPDTKYLAPELIDSSTGRCGPTADLYALGYTAIELLAGDRFDSLFGLPQGAQWLAWHADAGKQLGDWRNALTHVPTGLLDIIAGLIPKRPSERLFPSATQLKLAIQRAGLACEQRMPRFERAARGPDTKRPKRAGPFDLVSSIHRGSRGHIHLGRWRKRDNREVAVRLVPTEYGVIRSLTQGLQAASQLRDRHLVRVLGGGAISRGNGWTWFLATEHMRGGSLRDRLRVKRSIPATEAREIIRRVASGLAALHAAGIVHGNINSAAVLFDHRGRARLGDFYGLPGRKPNATIEGDLLALKALAKQFLPGFVPEDLQRAAISLA